MSDIKKKHHYLPQFYIGGFLNKDREVYVFDKKKGYINKQGKHGTFHLRYFYTIDFDKYEKRPVDEAEKLKKAMGIENVDTSIIDKHPNALEDLLSESESNASAIMPKLVNGEKINSWERIELATFMAFMYTRTPSFREKADDMEKRRFNDKVKKTFGSKENLEHTYSKMREDGYDKDIDLEEAYNIVKENRYDISIPKELNIQSMLYVTSIIDKILYKKTWFVTEAHSESSFVTTDIPILMAHSNTTLDTLRFDTPGVKILFPLSHKAILMMQDTPRGPVILNNRLNKVQTRHLNKVMADNAGNYIIAKDEALLKKVIRKNK